MPKRQYYRRPYRVRRKKSIFRSRFFGLGILILAILGASFYLLFFSEIFQIEKILVTGDRVVPKEDIQSLVPKGNIFLIDIQGIKKDILNNFPRIAEIEIHRSLPAALNILVAERSAVAIWCEEDTCFFVDGEGVIFEKVLVQTDLIKITGSRELLEKEKIAQIFKIQTKLKEGLGIATAEAFIVSEERLNIKTSESWEVYFNLRGDLDWQIQELKLVLEKQISPKNRRNLEYIDLRFTRVYYK